MRVRLTALVRCAGRPLTPTLSFEHPATALVGAASYIAGDLGTRPAQWIAQAGRTLISGDARLAEGVAIDRCRLRRRYGQGNRKGWRRLAHSILSLNATRRRRNSHSRHLRRACQPISIIRAQRARDGSGHRRPAEFVQDPWQSPRRRAPHKQCHDSRGADSRP